MIETLAYNLPDIQLLEKEANQYSIWIPDKVYIVLGASNNAPNALITENVTADRVLVLKRPTGGQTVVLSPQTIVLAATVTDENNLKPKELFNKINGLIIKSIEADGVTGVTLRGISDIAIGGKKILGSSMYRRKNTLFYHAVLNFAVPSSLIERYLQHPSKEPDYRAGRSHSEFVTSLHENGYTETIQHLKSRLTAGFNEMFDPA
jgi:lipoate-protein ligase A